MSHEVSFESLTFFAHSHATCVVHVYAAAQYNLGQSYFNGQGVARDEAEAARWWRLAAAQGDGAAALNLANSFSNGAGVAQDHAAAAKWYRKAVENGEVEANHNLGLCYLRGNGVALDRVKAARCFRLVRHLVVGSPGRFAPHPWLVLVSCAQSLASAHQCSTPRCAQAAPRA